MQEALLLRCLWLLRHYSRNIQGCTELVEWTLYCRRGLSECTRRVISCVRVEYRRSTSNIERGCCRRVDLPYWCAVSSPVSRWRHCR
ncbi:uncharacterized protein YALI1_A10796g [Yarrowia lipolytica]|uniref:Uncharacterized protein n=1 Tax=Yarrowia lipolytica TaxID=4952 RepID=A0A1D8N4E9_YARLL|nr:hypothetical protein YALI1_A10796g [Yarrowia lipolytica]